MGLGTAKRASAPVGVRRWLLAGTVAAAGLAAVPLHAQTAPSPRVALVIGVGDYRSAPTPAAPDDAGLVAQTLAGAGFDVTAARDLDGNGLRQAFRDFLDKAGAAGPDGIAVVYLAGRAVQADGDNFFVPVDAKLARPADVPIETVRLGDFTHALAALPIQAKVVVVDAAYAGGPAMAPAGGPAATAPGLALADAEQGELIAFNATPGSVAPATQGPYGAYAQALVQGMKQGGVPVSEIFGRVRLAVDQTTGGAEVPWDSDKLTRNFTFFDRGPAAPAVASAQIPFASLEKRPIREFPPDQAYDVALARDTLPAYADFLAAFPDNPLARRVRLIVAVRREALFWRATVAGGSAAAFWTYLDRYPRGPHVPDARRRLAWLAAAAAPPPSFRPLVLEVPPPPPEEVVVFDRPVMFVDPGLPPPPPPPVFLLPPPIVVILPRPAPPPGPRLLPIPEPIAVPAVRPIFEPGIIVPPRGVGGDYPHPRPFRRGPNGDGLVGLDAPGAPPPGGPLPRKPAPPPPAPPPPVGAAPPAGVPIQPPGAPLPRKRAPGRPLPAPPPAAPSPPVGVAPPAGGATPPAGLPVPPPGAPSPRKPAPGRPLPAPPPPAPSPPVGVAPPAGLPVPPPAGAIPRKPVPGRPLPALPPPAPPPPVGVAPPAGGMAPPSAQRPMPQPPTPPGLRPAPPPGVAPLRVPPRTAPDAGTPGGARLPAAGPEGEPGTGHGHEARHPACGHPGEPACRP